MKIKVKKLEVKKDHRGWLAEIVEGKDVGIKDFGLILVTTAKPGQTKGGHYHKRKTEWYCVLRGKGLLTLVDNKSNEKTEMEVGEGNMVLVKIAPLITHAIKNIGTDELYLLSYIDEAFDKADPDTY